MDKVIVITHCDKPIERKGKKKRERKKKIENKRKKIKREKRDIISLGSQKKTHTDIKKR